jgi:hypothetical protein
MEGELCRDIDISDAIAIGEAEGLLVPHVVGYPLEAPARQGVIAGIHQRDSPGFGVLVMDLHPVA